MKIEKLFLHIIEVIYFEVLLSYKSFMYTICFYSETDTKQNIRLNECFLLIFFLHIKGLSFLFMEEQFCLRILLQCFYRYKKMRNECQWDNSPSKSQFVKVNHYRSKYGPQHKALTHTKQQAIKNPKYYKCKPIQ